MRYFIDTEFIESGPNKPIYLISLGIVAEDGREYYAENSDAPLVAADEWVWENVIDKLHGPEAPLARIRQDVLDFIGDDPRPEFWAWFADYDWVVFCQAFGRMVDLPERWPKFCMDVKQWSVMLGDFRFPKQTGTEHDALEDARDCRRRWHLLNEHVKRYGYPRHIPFGQGDTNG